MSERLFRLFWTGGGESYCTSGTPGKTYEECRAWGEAGKAPYKILAVSVRSDEAPTLKSARSPDEAPPTTVDPPSEIEIIRASTWTIGDHTIMTIRGGLCMNGRDITDAEARGIATALLEALGR